MQHDSPVHIAGGKAADDTDLIIRRRHRIASSMAPPTGGTLLDFGCGNGSQTALFASGFATVVGVDVSSDYLAQFRGRFAGPPSSGANHTTFTALHFDGDHIPVRDHCVDYAVSFEVLEHVRDDHAVLRELARVVRPDGCLVVSVPNRWWVFETHGASLPWLRWNRVPFFSWLPTRVHDRWARARIYSRGRILRALRTAGFTPFATAWVTAPMDVVPPGRLRDALRASLFRPDQALLPTLATSILVAARR